jgi:hypothetical protein
MPQPNPHGCSSVGFRICLDTAIVQLNDFIGERQPDAIAAGCLMIFPTKKWFKNMFKLIFGDAGAFILKASKT